MLFFTIVKVAFKSILANKLRSFLTMLGVIIGVAAVIAMLGLGSGTQEKMTEQIRSMGANLLNIRATWSRAGGGVFGNQVQSLKIEDAQALLSKVDDVNMVSPEVSSNGQVKYFAQNRSYSIQGITATWFNVRNNPIEKGRELNDGDIDRQAHVACIGAKVVDDLFNGVEPLGETIKVKGSNFRVVGVVKRKGDGWGSPDDQVFIPLSTAMSQVMGKTNLGTIAVQIRAGADMTAAQEKVTEQMRKQHKIQPGREDDFEVRNLEEMRQQLENISAMFTMLLAGVASISLLVGGIGIMNIMLVTVTERTREIGVRKALGARRADLMSQFLLEAVVVSVTGGAIGAAFGVSSILTYNYAMKASGFYAKVELWPIALSFLFSVFVGIFFGWYPARKAAKMDPIDALRYE